MFFSFIDGVYTGIQDWSRAKMKSEDFIEILDEKKQKISLGCTFLPEKVEGWGEGRYGLEILKTIVERFEIRDIRIGIRWNRIEGTEGVRTLEYYEPYFRYLAEQNVRITLNIGPIKSCGWPEIHIPEFYTSKYGIPKRGVIESDSDLAVCSYNYLEWLLPEIMRHKVWKKVVAIQPENESFNPFGDKEWTTSSAYLKQIIHSIRTHTQQSILLNSSGLFDARKIIRVFHALPVDDCILGVDYYYTFDPLYKYKWTRVFDHVTMRPSYVSKENLRKFSKLLGFQVEVTEAQFEPWGRAVHPGQTRTELQWIILRAIRFCDAQDSAIIRLWGIEQLADRLLQNKTWSDDISQIQLIKTINTRQ